MKEMEPVVRLFPMRMQRPGQGKTGRFLLAPETVLRLEFWARWANFLARVEVRAGVAEKESHESRRRNLSRSSFQFAVWIHILDFGHDSPDSASRTSLPVSSKKLSSPRVQRERQTRSMGRRYAETMSRSSAGRSVNVNGLVSVVMVAFDFGGSILVGMVFHIDSMVNWPSCSWPILVVSRCRDRLESIACA